MRWNKYNNPIKKHKRTRKSPYSQSYIDERKDEMYRLIANAKTDAERDAIIKAFYVSINP